MVNLTYWKVLTRRKTIAPEPDADNKFHRVLKTFDLTALGVGATLGVGVYVLTGHVARDQAGPSVILSFAIAAIASLFAGLCYAEFGARVPKAGSAYIYSYVCIGEFAAFIIGWNLMLEYIIGSASVSRAISLYLDTLINDTLKVTFMEVSPINWGFIAPYFDFFACSLAIIVGVSLAFGVQASKMITNTFTLVNIGVVLFVVIAGSFKADPNNWKIDPADVKEPYILGKGGFFPFGFEGTIRGAATCFFGFVGFDCIATTGEEVKDPRRSIPRSILLSLLIIFLSYFGVSTVLTLMWPYYMQNVDAPLPFVFQEIKWPIAKWIVTIGGMIGLLASLFGSMFPLPRIIYAMSKDGLIFRHLGIINSKYKTPLAGNICAAFLTGLMAALFDLTQLVNMLSIGTLMAYTVVGISITILRFMNNSNHQRELETNFTENTTLNGMGNRTTCCSFFLQIFNINCLREPTQISTRVVGMLLFFYCLCCFGFSLTFMHARNEKGHFELWALVLMASFLLFILLLLLAISIQPREKSIAVFRVPLVPLIPGISIFVNIYLMLQLDIYTWIRFAVWMAIGLPIYLVCMCIYKETKEVKSFNNASINEKCYQNGKITSIADEYHKTNGIITNDDLETQVSNQYEDNEQRIIRENILSSKQSLDEIVPVDEVADSHKEVKNSNGKIFFIEDTSSRISSDSREEEDAKSVIAMLDNVLQVEDSFAYSDFDRKTSIDSEMMPSFIETSTVAMIHNSYDSLMEEEDENIAEVINKDGENVPKETNEISENVLKTASNEEHDKDLTEIVQKQNEQTQNQNDLTAIENPDDNIEIPSLKIEDNNSTRFILNNTEDMEISQNHEVLNPLVLLPRNFSEVSVASHDEDAIHSKSFKEKLNRLLGQTQASIIKSKPLNTSAEAQNPNPTLPKLKSSNSEPDFSQLFSTQLIEDVPETNNGQMIPEVPSSSSGIPKAPKFDPILYKTVGNRKYNQAKERPKLDVFLLANAHEQDLPKSPVTESTDINPPSPSPVESPTLPFKKRLENILKMGPSLREIKTLPKLVAQPVLKDIHNKDRTNFSDFKKMSQKTNNSSSSSDYKNQFSQVLKSISDKKNIKQEQKQKVSSPRPATIEEALKNLKHVHEH